jgi:hypothetical protein
VGGGHALGCGWLVNGISVIVLTLSVHPYGSTPCMVGGERVVGSEHVHWCVVVSVLVVWTVTTWVCTGQPYQGALYGVEGGAL